MTNAPQNPHVIDSMFFCHTKLHKVLILPDILFVPYLKCILLLPLLHPSSTLEHFCFSSDIEPSPPLFVSMLYHTILLGCIWCGSVVPNSETNTKYIELSRVELTRPPRSVLIALSFPSNSVSALVFTFLK